MKVLLSTILFIFCISTSYAMSTISVSSKSFLIADANGTIIQEKNSFKVLPIASISKLVLSLLVTNQDMDEKLLIPSKRTLSTSIPRKVKSLTRKELLFLSLIRSDNLAAQVLCDNIDNCIIEMNRFASDTGMADTQFYDSIGLDRRNVSTAQDLLKLLIIATENHTITEISGLNAAELDTPLKTIYIKNTNSLTAKFNTVISKTGYTVAAGGCLVMVVDTINDGRIFAVLLGSRNTKTRIKEMERLVNNYDRN